MPENSAPDDLPLRPSAGLPSEPSQVLATAAACFESLQNVSQAILDQGESPEIDAVETLVKQRARLVETLYSLDLSVLSDEDKAPMAMHLANCRALDAQVDGYLREALGRMGQRLNAQHQARHVMGGYRSGTAEGVTTREDDA
ncbi:MAG: hypothetical protein AB7P76_11085 [Candidatus Melainabacteria bacterium]